MCHTSGQGSDNFVLRIIILILIVVRNVEECTISMTHHVRMVMTVKVHKYEHRSCWGQWNSERYQR